ncbi:phosphoribosylformylglycinamidine cyclo-ligase [Melissospora conviva]|uniref:phosphoribosylformylglycinamidine cyclo-ligase n=1 Tax=Melissospora conviva TaxID=3388432 RepID=UPI003B76E6D8
MTHVTERNGAASGPADGPAGGDRQPWTGGAGRGTRKRSASYADAGVSIEAGDRAVELLKSKVRQTRRPEVLGDLGGFAGLFRLDTKKYRNPILASSTDGVGTKLVIAQQLDIHDTVGIDLVAMVVDDLVACGAEPLFLLDYIATGEVVPDKVAEIGAGIADGCRYAGCALLGGETAEHPGVLRPDEYDISATGVGVVEESDILSRERVEVGDVVIAMKSSGLHSNGYSLVRHVLLGVARMRLDTVIEDFGRQRTLGEELLTPTRIYAKDCLKLIAEAEVRALAHVTGGGIPGNLVRILPENVDAIVNRATWKPQPVFDLIQAKGRIEDAEMESTFNMGVGMFAIVSAEDADRALACLTGSGVEAWQAGEIIEGSGNVQMVGQHTRG